MIEIRTVSGKKEIGKFVDFRTALYKDDPNAVPYLYDDEVNSLLPSQNPAFEFCEAEYYMAYRDGEPVGRIAAIINHKANGLWNQKNVRFGHFDFIDDAEVVDALLDRVRQFGKERGMDTIIGPMGFIDLEREGMLVDGFDVLQSMHANHNYPYYMKHMERHTEFQKDNDWVQERIMVPDQVPEKMAKITAMIGKRYNLHARKLTKKQLVDGGYAKTLFDILNVCYKELYEYSELSERQIDQLVHEYISKADLNLVTFVFDETAKGPDGLGKMVGFGVSFPSFSQALRRTKTGKLFPFGWWHLGRTLLYHNTDTVDLLLIGVLPEYRQKGANAILFDDLIHYYQKYHFKQALTMPMMETNNGVLSAWQYFDAKTVKRLRSYKAPL